ncbi:MAG: DUF6096 family protein [Aeromonadaceae bacterium]
MKNYHEFTVGEETYKARLSAGACVALEEKYGTSPINVLSVSLSKEEMPSMSFMLDVLHASLQKFHSKITLAKTYDLYDDMVDEGLVLADLFNIVMATMMASGYFKETATDSNETTDPAGK